MVKYLNSKINKLKHYISVLEKNWKDRIWLKYMVIWKILSPILFRKNNGTYILEEDWDNLIILDACRYDIFLKELKNYDIKGELQYRISRGSWTVSFLLENFSNGKLDNIVYVTANPYVNIYLKEKVYKIIPVWDFGWDKELKTVPPECVYEATLKAKLKYPEKRLIIHFIQPHEPFISLRIEIKNDTGISGLRYTALTGKTKVDKSIWELVERRKVDKNEAIQGYIKNLKWVMPYVVRLCKVLPGKTVITSDHGEAFGEKIHPLIPIRVYGHLGNVMIEPLVKVPWFICKENGSLDKVERELIRLKAKNLSLTDHKLVKLKRAN